MGWFKRTFTKTEPSLDAIPLVDEERIAALTREAEEGLLQVQQLQAEEAVRSKQVLQTVRKASEVAEEMKTRRKKNGYLDELVAAYETRRGN